MMCNCTTCLKLLQVHLFWIFKSLFFFFLAVQCAADRLDEFIETINLKLQPMFMQIRKGMSEENGHQCYALVSVFPCSVGRVSSVVRMSFCSPCRVVWFRWTQLKLISPGWHQITWITNWSCLEKQWVNLTVFTGQLWYIVLKTVRKRG